MLLDEIGELPLEVQSKLLRFVRRSTSPLSVPPSSGAWTSASSRRPIATWRTKWRTPVPRRPVSPVERHSAVNSTAARTPRGHPRARPALPGSVRTQVSESGARTGRRRRGRAGALQLANNIRELQNRIMRAVIMSTGDTLTLDAVTSPMGPHASVVAPGSAFPIAEESAAPAPTAFRTTDASSSLAALRDCHRVHRLDDYLFADDTNYPPLGRWLDNDLVLAAFEQAGRIARRASHRLWIAGDDLRGGSAAHRVKRNSSGDRLNGNLWHRSSIAFCARLQKKDRRPGRCRALPGGIDQPPSAAEARGWRCPAGNVAPNVSPARQLARRNQLAVSAFRSTRPTGSGRTCRRCDTAGGWWLGTLLVRTAARTDGAGVTNFLARASTRVCRRSFSTIDSRNPAPQAMHQAPPIFSAFTHTEQV